MSIVDGHLVLVHSLPPVVDRCHTYLIMFLPIPGNAFHRKSSVEEDSGLYYYRFAVFRNYPLQYQLRVPGVFLTVVAVVVLFL